MESRTGQSQTPETYDVISFRSFGFEITLKRFFETSCCRDFQTTWYKRDANKVKTFLNAYLIKTNLKGVLSNCTPTHCRPLHPTPIHSRLLQPTPGHSNPLQPTPTHSRLLQPTPAYSNPLQATPTHSRSLRPTPTHSRPLRPTQATLTHSMLL